MIMMMKTSPYGDCRKTTPTGTGISAVICHIQTSAELAEPSETPWHVLLMIYTLTNDHAY